MCNPELPVSLAGSRMDPHFHACAFFHDEDERYDVLLPFVTEGFRQGDKAVHVTSREGRDPHRARLARSGVEVDAAEQTRQLEVMTWEQSYLRGGSFDPDAMLRLFAEVIDEARSAGFPRTRIIGDMAWALEDRAGVDRVVEYEARVNQLLASRRQPAVCAYDVTRFPSSLMLDVLRVHPLVVIGGVMQENPFFVPADRFLAELPPPFARQ